MKTRHLLREETLEVSPYTGAFAAGPADVRLTVAQEPAGPRIEPEVYGRFAEQLGSSAGCLLSRSVTGKSPADRS